MAIGDIGFLQQNPLEKLTGGFATGFNMSQGVMDQTRANDARQMFGQAAQTGDINPLLAAANPALFQAAQANQFELQDREAQAQANQLEIDETERQRMLDDVARDAKSALDISDPALRNQFLGNRAQKIAQAGGDPSDTLSLMEMPFDQQTAELNDALNQALPMSSLGRQSDAAPAEQKAFEALIKDLTPKQQQLAKEIKAGVKPRATGSAAITIAENKGLTDLVADSNAKIKQREKFGELTGASRAKAIDTGIEKIQGINKGISNIERAITEIENGASTGAIQRYLPSFKAASVALDNIQNELALDVIGGVTLGAISEAELDLAKQVALPQGLDGPELIAHLQERKAAQEKLRGYFNEQIQHLDQGGTVASFLRQKERENQAPEATEGRERTGGQIMTDANGNRAMVYPDGTYEEL